MSVIRDDRPVEQRVAERLSDLWEELESQDFANDVCFGIVTAVASIVMAQEQER